MRGHSKCRYHSSKCVGNQWHSPRLNQVAYRTWFWHTVVSIISFCWELMHYSIPALLESQNKSRTPIHTHSPKVWSDLGAYPEFSELILQKNETRYPSPGNPHWVYFEGSSCSGNALPLSHCLSLLLQESNLMKKERRKHAEFCCLWIKTNPSYCYR